MTKRLVLLGVYVDNAMSTARDYELRLSMRRIAEHVVRDDDAHSQCVIMAGSERPPWVAIFSGHGGASLAARVRSERGIGLHQLVYLTHDYEQDRAWLRRRDLGEQDVVPLASGHALRRIGAPLPELGVRVDLVEEPAEDLPTKDWLEPLVRALIRHERPTR